MKFLCVGMMVCDVLLSPVPDDILQRDSVTIARPSQSCGGDALNVAMGLAKLGGAVAVSGRVADDANGAFIRKECAKLHIGTSGLLNDPDCATAASFALIDNRGERHFLTDKSIFAKLTASDVTDEQLQWADVVYFGSAMALPSMNDGGLASLFSRAHSLGKLTAMDAAIDETQLGPDWLERLAPALAHTDYFLPSIDEARLITGRREPEEIAARFRSFPLKALVIKLGGAGCYVTDFSSEARIPGVTGIQAVDTTGAGDSFVAGFLCALSHGFPPFRCAAFANCVAAQNVQAVGGTAGIPNYPESLTYFQTWEKITTAKMQEEN